MSNDSIGDPQTRLPNNSVSHPAPIPPSSSGFDGRSIGDQQTSLPNAARMPSAAPGTSIAGRYELIRQLGRGGMGEVHLCRDTRLNREVALKRLLSDGGMHTAALERFRREANAIAQLSHPNIVHLYDFGDDASGPYIVMELLSGSDLQVWVREHGKRASSEVLRIARQICQGLAYAHPDLEVAAREQFHDHVRARGVVAKVVQVHDVGMRQLRDRVGFATEPFERRGVHAAVGEQALEGDIAVQPGVAA